MREYKDGTKIVQYLSLVKCNKCGKEIHNGEDEFFVTEDIIPDIVHEIKISFGYGSNLDGQTFRMDLCDECIEKLVDSFIIPVDIDRWI